MDSLFRVYLSGTFLNDEPLGLNDTELTITRDELLKGVFFAFTSELIFWGDGYAALKLIRDTQAGCSQVACNIEYKCAETGGYEVLFEGIIPLGSEDVEWDDYNCKVTSKVENADFSNFLKLYGDFVFLVNRDRCIDNSTSLTTITTNDTQFFSAFNGTYNTNTKKTYLFTDVLQQLLSYLSNNTITLNEDPLYSTLLLPQILRIDFVDALAVGDVIELNFTNYYGQDYTVTHTCFNIQSVDIAIFLRKCLHIVAGAVTYSNYRENFFEKASDVDEVEFITNYLPWTNYTIEVNAGAKVVNITEEQAFQYGLKNLALTSATLLQEQEGSLSITLNEILVHASQMHNMGFQIVKVGANYQFNLTFLPDLIVNTDSTVSLPEVEALTSKTSGTFNASSITSPKGIADNAFKPFTWTTENCYGNQMKIEGENYSSQDFFDILNATQVQDDAVFFVFLTDGDYTKAARYRFGMANFGAFASAQFLYHYNIPYLMALIIKQNEISASNNNLLGQIPIAPLDAYATCSQCPAAFITNTNTVLLRMIYKFDYPLSFTQVQNLISNSLQYIPFSDGRKLAKNGFIKEVIIPFKNFICSFELYSD